MRVDRVIRDARLSLTRILEALDHNLTVRDNFAPEGSEGEFLMSNGPNTPPTFRSATSDELGEHTHDAADIISGIFNPARLGAGSRTGSRFLRDDSTWRDPIASVPWANLTGKPTDFAGYGLDDDLAAALAGYSRIGHHHYYDEIIGTPAPGGGGLTAEDVQLMLAPYALIGHTHHYESLMGRPDFTAMLAPYAVIGHNHRVEAEAVAMEFILANQIFGG